MSLAIAIVLLVIVGVVIGAAGMFFAVSQPAQDDPDEEAHGDWPAMPPFSGDISIGQGGHIGTDDLGAFAAGKLIGHPQRNSYD